MSTPSSKKSLYRVLFVDDEVRITQNLRAVLRKLPIEVRTATSAEQGLEVLAGEPMDIVVSDERMPGMPGSRFLAEVRRRYPETIRIILTGQASLHATIEAINEGGIFRFLAKPCNAEDLIATLEEAMAVIVKQRASSTEFEQSASQGAEEGTHFDDALAGCWMAYQPIISSVPGVIYGYEALLRPDHPEFAGPMELIHAAERLDRLPDLERHVCELVARELDSAPPPLSLLMNIHPQMLNEPDLFDPDLSLHRHAERVLLEITERAPLESVVDCAEKITALRGRGYRIALDDLGAGYSGLVNFAELRPDLVKFDRALISHVDERPIQSRLLASIIRVCNEMSVKTVGEGIERPEEYEHLETLGCDYFQGFLFGRPEKPFSEPVWPDRPKGA